MICSKCIHTEFIVVYFLTDPLYCHDTLVHSIGSPGRSLKMLKSPPPPNPPALNISVSHNITMHTQSSPSSVTSESSHTSTNTNSSSATNTSNSSNSTINSRTTITNNNNAPTSSSNDVTGDGGNTGQLEQQSLVITEPDTSTVQPTATGMFVDAPCEGLGFRILSLNT